MPAAIQPVPSAQELREIYVARGCSYRETAAELGVSYWTVAKWLRMRGIPIRPGGGARNPGGA